VEKYGDLVTLAEGQVYTKMIDPLIFIDKEYGEWKTAPNNVLNKGCVHPKRKLEKRKATTLQKYGVDNVFKSAKIKEKRANTMLENYGVIHALQSDEFKDKAKATSRERFGVDYAAQNKEVYDKIKATVKEVYGTDHPMHSEVVKAKVIETNKERYGVANVMHDKDIRQRARQTNQERYGGNAPACDVNIVKKIKETNKKRYGGNAPLSSKEIRKKVKDTNLIRYGAENPFGSPSIKEKIRQVLLERYGVEHPILNAEIRQKWIDTCLAKYGYKSPLDVPQIRKNAIQTKISKYGWLVLSTGITLSDYLREHNRMDLNYTSCKYVYLKYGFAMLQEYVEGNRTFGDVTSLEHQTSALLGVPHLGKVIHLAASWSKPDFQLSDKVYLDADGLFYHSSYYQKDLDYHFKKRLKYESDNKRLLQFREDEIRDKPLIVKSIVDNVLGKTRRLFARKAKTIQVPWTEAEIFLKENHLQGVGAFATAYGLEFPQEGLMMLLCVRKKEDGLELSRMCTKVGHTVLGGFSRLLIHAIKQHKPAFVSSWCDLRYADGRGYEKLGFDAIRDVQSWAWTDYENVYHRLRCRANMDERCLSEADHAAELGWVKIYDAGQRLYMLTCTAT